MNVKEWNIGKRIYYFYCVVSNKLFSLEKGVVFRNPLKNLFPFADWWDGQGASLNVWGRNDCGKGRVETAIVLGIVTIFLGLMVVSW